MAVISSKACASGKGEGCDDLAEGNDFIRSLQQKSAANADIYAKVSFGTGLSRKHVAQSRNDVLRFFTIKSGLPP
jgi:hypothetical protein